MSQNFVPEIKEGEAHQPCRILLNLDTDIGIGDKSLYLELPKGTGMVEAQLLKDALRQSKARLRLV